MNQPLWSLVVAGIVIPLWAYLGYPLALLALTAWRRLPNDSSLPLPPTGPLPSVSLLIAAHNESGFIRRRIENALATEYPSAALEIMVASDGSTDGTDDIVNEYGDQGVRLVRQEPRAGKASALNLAIPLASGDLVILSDANTFFDPDAIGKLQRSLDDPSVAVAVGRLTLVDSDTGTNADGLYWRLENVLKARAGAVGAVPGANGAIYAFRRPDYSSIPAGTILDDLVNPLQIVGRRGGQIVYVPGARAVEETPGSWRDEFHRRTRIGAGGFQALPLVWSRIWDQRGWLRFTLVSHKVCRWFSPFALIVALVATGGLAAMGSAPARAFLALQLFGYAAGLSALWLPPGGGIVRKMARLPGMFISLNAAILIGCWRHYRRGSTGTWAPTLRTQPGSSPR